MVDFKNHTFLVMVSQKSNKAPKGKDYAEFHAKFGVD